MKPNTISLTFTLALLGFADAGTTAKSTPTPMPSGFTIPGFGEINGKEETRQSVITRFGPPLTNETTGASNEYHVLTYPLKNDTNKLFLLFHKEEFLAMAREQPRGREMIESTMRGHARNQDDKVVLFRSSINGDVSFFTATRDRLAKTPNWVPGDAAPAPLSKAQAEAIALEWRRTNAPTLLGQIRVMQTHECLSVRGKSFYVVSLGSFQAPPHRREIVVLMDGSIVPAEIESRSRPLRER